MDLTVTIGIAAAKTNFNTANGITIRLCRSSLYGLFLY